MTLSPLPLLEAAIALAGVAQLALAVGSLAISRLLGWRAELAVLRPLTRQVFWTYAVYIWCTNLSFGLLSALGGRWLLDGSPLAAAVTAFIAAYWGARLAIQFLYYDRSGVPPGWLPRVGEPALVCLFAFLALTYGAASLANLSGGLG
jgi:hypothetical protein